MAVYSITCYFNTGFNAQNIPDSPAILATAQSKTFPSNWLLQNKDRVQTRVNAGWDEISEVDYVKIGDAYYYVVNVNMLTETNAELTLVMDFLTTLGGVRNITISDGWVKRAHVKDDTLFYNVQPEPFKPSANMIIDGAQELKPSRVNERYLTTYVGATIDLLSTERLAEEYKNASDETLVSVPKVTPISKETTVKMTLPNGNVEENTLPNQTLYEFDKEAVKEGIRSARSLGLDTAITSCYVVPDGWRRTISMNTAGDIRSITGACEEVTPAIPFKYETGGTIHNNKVFALFNSYFVLSICSGDKLAFEAYEIGLKYNSPMSRPKFQCFADMTPNGAPYCQPSYYNTTETPPFLMAVKGMNWQNTPFTFMEKSGALIDTQTFNRQMRQMQSNANANQVKAGMNLAANYASLLIPTPGNIAGAVNGTIDYMQTAYNAGMNMENAQLNYETQQNIRVPEINFPRDESIQNFIGNSFFIYRVRLANYDALRLDRFFTMYGYATEKPLERSDFTNRRFFNFVQATGVNIKVNKGMRFRAGACAQLEQGVRVWHVLPDPSYYSTGNPIA